jgi:heme exporter protein A
MLRTPLAVEVNDVSKRYGKRWALARLSFRLPSGGSLLLTGSNGSGKTTLLRTIATAIRPTAGTIRVLGLDSRADRQEVRERVALLSHTSFLYEDLTAEQNLRLLARLIAADSPEAKIGSLLERVGLAQRSRHPVRQFSAGMRKRLSIARLLLKSPPLALLDEPFGELDPVGVTDMERIIAELKSAGTTIVLATHLVEQGLSLCEERLHLSEGRAVAA